MKVQLKLHVSDYVLILISILMLLTKRLTMMVMETFHMMNWLNSLDKTIVSQ